MLEEFKKYLGAYNNRDLQNFLFFLSRMESFNIPIEIGRAVIEDYFRLDKMSAIVNSPKKNREYKVPEFVPESCPKCGEIFLSYPVNTSKRNMVDGGYTNVKICGACHYEEWIS